MVTVPQVDEVRLGSVIRIHPQVEIDLRAVVRHTATGELPVDPVARSIFSVELSRQTAQQVSQAANLLVVHQREYIGVRSVKVYRIQLFDSFVNCRSDSVKRRVASKHDGNLERI